MPLLPGVFLSDLQFHRHVRLLQTAEERRNRFANLKVNWPMFNLNNNVVIEFAIERMEYVVGSSRAICLGILPVEVMVVHKCPVKNDSAVGLERACNDVGGVRRRPAVNGRAGPTFGVRLHDKSAKVRNPGVDRVHFFAPPLVEARIKRIKRVEPADSLRTAQVNRNGDSNAPFAECLSDASELRKKFFCKEPRIRIDIVDGTAVDPDRSQQACVLADERQVAADPSILEKDGAPAVSSLDSTIRVVPLVHPPQAGVRLLNFIQGRNIHVTSYLAQ